MYLIYPSQLVGARQQHSIKHKIVVKFFEHARECMVTEILTNIYKTVNFYEFVGNVQLFSLFDKEIKKTAFSFDIHAMKCLKCNI